MSQEDRLFAEKFKTVKSFCFDQKVVNVFPDMIKRSVPGYDVILKGIAMFAMQNVVPKTNIYDLGSSLGAVSLTIDQAIGDKKCLIVAVDNSKAMFSQFKEILKQQNTHNKIKPLLQSIQDMEINNASMVVSNFTMQFIDPDQRDNIYNKIYQGLNQGAVMLLSEKIRSSPELADYYHGYKKINGYSDLEIAQKRQALEDSLKPDTIEQCITRLKLVGFKQIALWYRAFNFVSFICHK